VSVELSKIGIDKIGIEERRETFSQRQRQAFTVLVKIIEMVFKANTIG
jgi:hypothetical protein